MPWLPAHGEDLNSSPYAVTGTGDVWCRELTEKDMKRIMCFAFAASMLLASTVVADPQLLIDRATGYFAPTSGGGEFTIYSPTLSNVAYSDLPEQTRNVTSTYITVAGSFQSFCLELGEEVVPGDPYYYKIGTAAVEGGVPGGSDPLGAATAWLYTQFATGQLANYNYTVGSLREASAKQLQNAIWYLEGETGTFGFSAQTMAWITAAESAAATPAVWGDTIGNVRVLNLFTKSIVTQCQSQLYMVPVPGAVLLGLLGLGYAGTKLRKMV